MLTNIAQSNGMSALQIFSRDLLQPVPFQIKSTGIQIIKTALVRVSVGSRQIDVSLVKPSVDTVMRLALQITIAVFISLYGLFENTASPLTCSRSSQTFEIASYKSSQINRLKR